MSLQLFVLLVIAVALLGGLVYKSNFILGVCVQEKTERAGVGAVPGFRLPLGSWNVPPAPPSIRGGLLYIIGKTDKIGKCLKD